MMKIAVLCVLVAAVSCSPSFRERLLKRDDDCVGLFGECKGLPTARCCGETVCFWEDGYSLTTSGYCVSCVDVGQRCQKDSQCCDATYCKKGNMFHIDGVCHPKLPKGAECYQDDSCYNGDCVRSFIKGECN